MAGWSTQDELDYIDKLAKGKCSKSIQTSPVELLDNYQKSAMRRIEADTFGTVDGHQVLNYARRRQAILVQGHA